MSKRETRLWYKKPASDWNEALPLGNGRLGMMVYGGINQERLQLNEETLWSGRPQDADNPDCKSALPRIRELLFAGRLPEAEALCREFLVCRGPGSSSEEYGSYQTAGELSICDESSAQSGEGEYYRSLDLNDGIVLIQCADIRRRFLVSDAYDVCAAQICGDSLKLRLNFSREGVTMHCEGNEIIVEGRFEGEGALSWSTIIHAVTDGSVRQDGNSLLVCGKRVIIYISTSTNYCADLPACTSAMDMTASQAGAHNIRSRGDSPFDHCRSHIDNAVRAGFEEILEKHLAYMHDAMSSCELMLEGDEAPSLLPTDERLRQFRMYASAVTAELNAVPGKIQYSSDPRLSELFFRFAKYLLICSSKGQLPANLQGIWSKDIQTPWNGDYHLNINLQMNYWAAEVMSLAAYTDPLFRYIAFLARHGARTARLMYGCEGWVAHTITNPWGFTAPGEDPAWGSFLCAGAWCCRHYMEHYRYTGETAFLREYYPVMRDSARFFLDFLTTDPRSDYLVTAPSNSPENHYIDPISGYVAAIAAGPSMDNSILRELFSDTVEAAQLLGTDEVLQEELARAVKRLPPLSTGKHRQILEWQEDYEEADPGHRHLSHLYGLYPGTEITDARPELYKAARTTLERRLSHGGGHTGWSRAWIINLYARLKDGAEVLHQLDSLYSLSTQDNLFDTHPPFQIDGNFGGAAGIAEALLQSHAGRIELLPALPPTWKKGSFRRLRARGGFIVSASWSDGLVTECTIESLIGGQLHIYINGTPYERAAVPKEIIRIL